jgi:hypothetical protein
LPTSPFSALYPTQSQDAQRITQPGRKPVYLTEDDQSIILSQRNHNGKHKEVLKRVRPPSYARRPATEPLGIIFDLFCLMAYGRKDLDHVWTAIILDEIGDGSVWNNMMERLGSRLSNMNIVVSVRYTYGIAVSFHRIFFSFIRRHFFFRHLQHS